MTISDNSFSEENIPTSSNSASVSLTPSSNSFSMVTFTGNANPWSGPNMGGGKFGNEDVDGGPGTTFGDGEFGGIGKSK